LDSTNVIDRPAATGIADLALDHQQFLGSSLAEIAAEKAGIAKPAVPLVSLAQPPEAEEAIARIAAERGAPLLLMGRDWTLDPDINSIHSRPNHRPNPIPTCSIIPMPVKVPLPPT